jgi:hypothetical protein
MATFRFNFLEETAEGGDTAEENGQQIGALSTATNQDTGSEDVRIIPAPAQEDDLIASEELSKLQFGEYILYRLDDEDHSSDYDLIPGAYEGGRKVTLCGILLLNLTQSIRSGNAPWISSAIYPRYLQIIKRGNQSWSLVVVMAFLE